MNFLETSRKDDLISLFYILIYLLNSQSLWVGNDDPTKNVDKQGGDQAIFNNIEKWKREHNLIDIAELFSKQYELPLQQSNEANELNAKNFKLHICLVADVIENTGFSQKPEYGKI